MQQPPSLRVSIRTLLEGVPAEWPLDPTDSITAKLRLRCAKVVVIDDDPTGCQTVSGIPLLTEWSVDQLSEELLGPSSCFFILTNTRSLSDDEAAKITREVASHLLLASQRTGIEFVVVSRGDSTLRGHFRVETDTLVETLPSKPDALLFIPYFGEGGRVTANDIHYVKQGDDFIPAAETESARDATFGYRSSNLISWIIEKMPEHSGDKTSISLDEIRMGGPDAVAQRLMSLPSGSICIINALSRRDIEVFVDGLLTAESNGRRFLYRSSASFIPVRAGLPPSQLLVRSSLGFTEASGGLIVVGSHTQRSTQQLSSLLSNGLACGVELNASDLTYGPELPDRENLMSEIDKNIVAGTNVVLYTSRETVLGATPSDSLRLSRNVSRNLSEIIRSLNSRPRYIVAKGGITSHDVAMFGLGAVRSVVLGQIQPGVPVWRLGDETKFPGLCYVVFPGNVGDANLLSDIVRDLAITG